LQFLGLFFIIYQKGGDFVVDIERLKQAKKEKKLSYDDLAAMTGYSRSTITNIFCGYIEFPRHETIEAIERALGIDEEKKPSDDLSEGEKALLELFNQVPAEQQALVVQMIKVALQNI
jgi:transcriptional regulator with XRE-family HTH domain